MGASPPMEIVMTDREKQQQIFQAELDRWKAEVEMLKNQASTALTSAQEEMHRHVEKGREIEALENQIAEAEEKLEALATADDNAWESLKERVESAWDSLRSAVGKSTQ